MTMGKKIGITVAVLAISSGAVGGYTHLASKHSVPDEARQASERRLPQADAVEIETAPVRRSQITSELCLVGSLIPYRFANIVAEVDGVIASISQYEKPVEYELNGRRHAAAIDLDIGHPVKKGDVLVEIDGTEYQLALSRAEAQLKLAENELEKLRSWNRAEEVAQLRAQLQEAKAVYEQTAADRKRMEELLAKRVVSQSDFDRAEMSYRTAEAGKAKAEAALQIAEAGPTPEEIAVAEAKVAVAKADVALQSEKLSKCTIRAPYDAVVVDRYVGVGDRVTAAPKVNIMQIIDPSILFAEVGVSERYQGRVRQNDRAEVRARDSATRVPGVVALVNEKIDPETRTFRVRVAVDNQDRLFKAGSFVSVALALDAASEALLVPISAVTFTEGRPAVFVYRNGHVERRSVTLGISNESQYEVLSGVSEGELVAVGNISLLADGLNVRPKPASL